MSVINTNITSMIGQSNLQKSQSSLQTSMERLSSGLRINSAKDDAAGQAIANRMSAQITGLSQAQRNANDGISVAQTAEGGLNQINDNLQRIRELTVQSANGTNSQNDLQSIQDEVDQRLEEIDRISRETDFNGTNVLADGVTSLDIQVGANDDQIISVDLQAINRNELNLDNFRVAGDQQVTQAQLEDDFGATLQSATFSDGTDTYYVDSNGDAFSDEAATTAVYVDANGDFTDTENRTAIPDITDATNITTANGWTEVSAPVTDGANGTYTLDVDGVVYTAEINDTSGTLSIVAIEDTDSNALTGAVYQANGGTFTQTEARDQATQANLETASFEQTAANYAIGTDTYAVDSEGVVTDADGDNVYVSEDALVKEDAATLTTENPLAALDDALKQVDSLRSELGAVQNRFESAITNLQTNETNLSAARSRIEDADYATEVANMTRAQILQQAGTSVLAQANQIPQNVLSLLG